MPAEEDFIIGRLSDPELILWFGKFGLDRLSNSQRARVVRLVAGIGLESETWPRRIEPEVDQAELTVAERRRA